MIGLNCIDMEGLNSWLQKQEVSHQLSKSTGLVPKQLSFQNCFWASRIPEIAKATRDAAVQSAQQEWLS